MCANSAPAAPAYSALITNASSLYLRTLTPAAAAAIVSSRMAWKARPVAVAGAVRSGASRVEIELSDASMHAPVDRQLAPVPGEWKIELTFRALESEAWKRPGAVVDLDVAIRNVQTGAALEESRLFSSPIVYRLED